MDFNLISTEQTFFLSHKCVNDMFGNGWKYFSTFFVHWYFNVQSTPCQAVWSRGVTWNMIAECQKNSFFFAEKHVYFHDYYLFLNWIFCGCNFITVTQTSPVTPHVIKLSSYVLILGNSHVLVFWLLMSQTVCPALNEAHLSDFVLSVNQIFF